MAEANKGYDITRASAATTSGLLQLGFGLVSLLRLGVKGVGLDLGDSQRHQEEQPDQRKVNWSPPHWSRATRTWLSISGWQKVSRECGSVRVRPRVVHVE